MTKPMAVDAHDESEFRRTVTRALKRIECELLALLAAARTSGYEIGLAHGRECAQEVEPEEVLGLPAFAREVLGVLQGEPDRPWLSKQLIDMTGFTDRLLRDALERLCEAGLVQAVRKGRWWSLTKAGMAGVKEHSL